MNELPIEIINHIFVFLSSPTAEILKTSIYYNSGFPFLLLQKKTLDSYYLQKKSRRRCLNFYIELYKEILNYEDPYGSGRYKWYHIFSNYETDIIYSDHILFNFQTYYVQWLKLIKHYDERIYRTITKCLPKLIFFSMCVIITYIIMISKPI